MSDAALPPPLVRIRPQRSAADVMTVVIVALCVLGAARGDWRGVLEGMAVAGGAYWIAFLPRVTISGDRLSYRTPSGSFDVARPDVAGVTPNYVFKGAGGPPISLNVRLRGEDRDRVLDLDRFSRGDVGRILAFFSISLPGTTR